MKKWLIVLAMLLGSVSGHLQAYASQELQYNSITNASEIETDPLGIKISAQLSKHIDGLKRVLFDPYFELTRNPVNLRVSADPADWLKADLLELEMHDALAACDKGDLNLLPLNRILPFSEQMVDHFVSGALQPCAVGQSIWATVVAYDSSLYNHDRAPVLIQDFFNITAYPGKRALRRTPRAFSEWALHVAGISDEAIYNALDTNRGWDEIEQTLHEMGPHIFWVESDEQAIDLLKKGVVSFAMVESQALVRDLAKTENDSGSIFEFGIIWDKAVAYMSMWAIPKQAQAESALDFLRFAVDPANNLHSATSFGYAPARKFQTALIEEKYRRVLPVGEKQTRNLMWGNSKWWREHGEELESWFSDYSHQLIDPDLIKTELKTPELKDQELKDQVQNEEPGKDIKSREVVTES